MNNFVDATERLERSMLEMHDVCKEIDLVIHMVGDVEHTSEDEILNALIGIHQLCSTRHERMMNLYNQVQSTTCESD